MPLLLDEVVKVEVEMMAATGRVAAGHRLRVEISPAEGRGANPDWERGYDDAYHRGAVNRLFTGGAFPSSVTIPAVPRRQPASLVVAAQDQGVGCSWGAEDSTDDGFG